MLITGQFPPVTAGAGAQIYMSQPRSSPQGHGACSGASVRPEG